MPTGEHMTVIGETNRQSVLDYLIHEADLDGLVTVTEEEIGSAVGLTRCSVMHHIHALASDGALVVNPHAAGYKGMNAIQLAESVTS